MAEVEAVAVRGTAAIVEPPDDVRDGTPTGCREAGLHPRVGPSGAVAAAATALRQLTTGGSSWNILWPTTLIPYRS